MSFSRSLLVAALLSASATCLGQTPDRNTKVRNDREAFKDSQRWVYNDLAQGIAEARKTGKPLLVVLRCIPCEACAGFDDQVARNDPRIDELMNQFVCVRIVQCNALDLELFQFDYDMSFAGFFLNADRTIYGRFGSMSNHDDAEREITIEGFRQAMLAALELHRGFPANKAALAGKHGPPPRYKTPEAYPTLNKYTPRLDYEGQVARSCIHCHQLRDAERDYLRAAGEPLSDAVLYPYPMPTALGLSLDPREKATVTRVAAGSAAEKAGFHAGDQIRSLAGQPLVSIADVQWVLQTAAEPAELTAEIVRQGQPLTLTLPLAAGWRRGLDISWRPTTWSLRRMAFGGMRLVDASGAERAVVKLDDRALALKVAYVGEFGDHALAKKAGFQANDILVEVGGRQDRLSESDLIVYLLRNMRPGSKTPTVVLRGGERVSLLLPSP